MDSDNYTYLLEIIMRLHYLWNKTGATIGAPIQDAVLRSKLRDPMMTQTHFIITYEGLHLHFAYSYFLMSQPHNPPIKKPKPNTLHGQAQDFKAQHDHEAQVKDTLGLASSIIHFN
ncbi:hypothetical protein Lal_00038295 [Lupinus albus]|nr:hypothetical protein Lal_00038295 [Lupinus albus]